MTDILMPKLSDSMEEGTIARWLKTDGDEVRRGEELVEIETDKATMAHLADGDGFLNIIVPEGETVDVGTVIARLGATAGERDVSAPRSEAPARASTAPMADVRNTTAAEQAPAMVRERPRISPLARRMARGLGVDAVRLTGTGPMGRIVKRDVLAAADGAISATVDDSASRQPAVATMATSRPREGELRASPPAVGAKGETEVVALSPVQQIVARRMAESRATIPDFTVAAEVDMTACVALREQLRAYVGDQPTPSYNDMVVKAVAGALRDYPQVNGSFVAGAFHRYSRVNVGVAVAGEGTLLVPTVFDADRLSLVEIAAITRGLAMRARDGAITPAELDGGTFTVSNLGMFGVTRFTAVVNPPQAAILAVGAMRALPRVIDGRVEAREVVELTLSSDHRILYGADAARFLGRVRELLERPVALLI